jgi:hypothetical protein
MFTVAGAVYVAWSVATEGAACAEAGTELKKMEYSTAIEAKMLIVFLPAVPL